MAGEEVFERDVGAFAGQDLVSQRVEPLVEPILGFARGPGGPARRLPPQAAGVGFDDGGEAGRRGAHAPFGPRGFQLPRVSLSSSANGAIQRRTKAAMPAWWSGTVQMPRSSPSAPARRMTAS